jgi:hypothetical protein
MPDGKPEQANESKGGASKAEDAKAASGSPKVDSKPSDGAAAGGAAAGGPPTEYEKKPKLSKQERRELQARLAQS